MSKNCRSRFPQIRQGFVDLRQKNKRFVEIDFDKSLTRQRSTELPGQRFVEVDFHKSVNDLAKDLSKSAPSQRFVEVTGALAIVDDDDDDDADYVDDYNDESTRLPR